MTLREFKINEEKRAEKLKKEFYENMPHLKDAVYINEPDDGLIELFRLSIANGRDSIYFKADGSIYGLSSQISKLENF